MSKNINKKEIKYLHNGRIDFSKISGTLPIPNLVEIQTKSFAWLKEKAAAGGYAGIDVYYGTDVVGVETNTLTSVYFEFPAAE